MTRVNNFVENGGRLCRTLARSVSVNVDPNARKKNSQNSPFFFGRLPRILPARENRISTQGAVQKWLESVIRPLLVVLVCAGSGARICTPVGPELDPFGVLGGRAGTFRGRGTEPAGHQYWPAVRWSRLQRDRQGAVHTKPPP